MATPTLMPKDVAAEEETRSARRVKDPELVAISKVTEAIEDLDPDQKRRVLNYLRDRYSPMLEYKSPEACAKAE